MSIELTTDKSKTVYIEDKPFKSGGQGGVYYFTGGQKNIVAKVFYHETNEKLIKAKKLEHRIKFMVRNSPIKNSSAEIQNTLIWPLELLYRKGHFVGFTMPIAGDSKLNEIPIKLSCLCKLRLHHSIKTEDKWQKFARHKTNTLKTRLKLCYNIANAVNTLHKTKNYILVDFKPDNILINSNGIMSIIDLDSIQIAKNNKVIFNAEAFTEEYIPPEHQKKLSTISHTQKDESWDRFCYAVLAYQLLLGIHPFTASHKTLHSTSEFIREGLFPNGKKTSKFLLIPAPHKSFKSLPKEIQSLFLRCFGAGHDNPARRPSLQEWAVTLATILFKPPKIHWFKANKTVRNNLDPIRLSWNVNDFQKIRVNGKEIKNIDHINVTPIKNTIYTLEAINGNKSVKAQVAIQIDKTPPKILFFNSNKTMLTNHLPAKLSWEVERAKKIEITKVGDVTNKNNCNVSPRKDTEYHLIVYGYFGQKILQRLQLKVSKKPPVIKYFKSSINHREDNSKVFLGWQVEGAFKLYIDEIGEVTNLKYIQVDPKKDTVYNFKAISYFGITTTKTLKITVSKEAPIIDSFTANITFLEHLIPVLLNGIFQMLIPCN
jgi:serine/threonine protein kinase